MPTNRIRHLGAVGFMVTVSLLLVLAVQVGLTAAATGTSGASSSGALQGAVRIHLKGWWPGPARGLGSFTISGAISDSGSCRGLKRGTASGRCGFVDRNGGGGRLLRILYGAKGTIRITAWRGNPAWSITMGTGAYAGLLGRGREGGLYRRTIDMTMSGTVSQ
jgi:hypothetical protein